MVGHFFWRSQEVLAWGELNMKLAGYPAKIDTYTTFRPDTGYIAEHPAVFQTTDGISGKFVDIWPDILATTWHSA